MRIVSLVRRCPSLQAVCGASCITEGGICGAVGVCGARRAIARRPMMYATQTLGARSTMWSKSGPGLDLIWSPICSSPGVTAYGSTAAPTLLVLH